jgi:aspartyl-tRNA(Asn)/glutamyl-tRNA(Gln) amidotransferase subunit A
LDSVYGSGICRADQETRTKTTEVSRLDEVLQWSLIKLARTIREKEVSPVEVMRQLLERIDSVDGKLNAFITVLSEESLAAAARAEKDILTNKPRGPLHGVPVGLKDIIYTRDIRTTMGSEIFKDYVPDYDATVVEKLKGAGAIIVGKLNTHQFAYGPTGDRSYFGSARNPYDNTKITGGSSAGSGAAVAAALCYAALGTDTGGSIRIPASCCGIVGMKPTFGRVSKYGVFPLSWTLDHVGPMTRTVEDNAFLLSILAGYDTKDPYSTREDTEDFTRKLGQEIEGGIVGVPSSFYFENVEQEVEAKVRHAIETLRGLGAKIREVQIPHVREIVSAQRLTLASEALTVHRERLRTQPERFEAEVRERLLANETTKAYEYVEAQQVKHLAVWEFNRALEEVDILVSPTIPHLPTDIDQREVDFDGHKEHVRSAITRLAVPTNLNGFPALSISCGFSSSGLPIGLQLMGKPFDEANLYRFGHAFERALSQP